MFNARPKPDRGALSVIGADVAVTRDVLTTGDLHINGSVEGQIDATALVIETGARITGDSIYETLTIATGAQVDGRMTHRGSGTDDTPLRLVDASPQA